MNYLSISHRTAHQDAITTGLGQFWTEHYSVDGYPESEEYLVWPNGEWHPAAEYTQWHALQTINAQLGAHG